MPVLTECSHKIDVDVGRKTRAGGDCAKCGKYVEWQAGLSHPWEIANA